MKISSDKSPHFSGPDPERTALKTLKATNTSRAQAPAQALTQLSISEEVLGEWSIYTEIQKGER